MAYAITDFSRQKYDYTSITGAVLPVSQRVACQANLPAYAQLAAYTPTPGRPVNPKELLHTWWEAIQAGATGQKDIIHRRRIVVQAVSDGASPPNEIVGSTMQIDGLTFQCTGFVGERLKGAFTGVPQ